MADSQSDADKIRNKRLAKLGSQAPRPSTPKDESSPSSSTAPEPSPSSAPKAAVTTPPAPSPKPQNSATGTQRIGADIKTSSHGDTSSDPSAKRSRPNEIPNKMLPLHEPFDVWEDKQLSALFRVTLDPSKKQDAMGRRLEYIGGLRTELEEQNAPLKLNIGLLDQAILEAASAQQRQSPLEYMLSCWKRVVNTHRAAKVKSTPERLESIKEAKRLCMSYAIFTVTMPDMFGREPEAVNPLAKHLLVEQEDERGLCHDFLLEFTSRFGEDDMAKDALVEAVEVLSRQLATITMNGDYKPYILAMRNLVRYPVLVNALAQSEIFLPDVPAATIEAESLLGPYFAISPLQADVTANYFSSPKTRDRGYIVNSQNALRMTLRTHQGDLLDITNHIIKTSKTARERMLDWFVKCVNLNHKRRAMQVDRKTVSSDGFMFNLTVCLDQLCEPFMDASFGKIDRIDVGYLRRNPRVDIKDETKLNADQNTSDSFYEQTLEGESSFISEVFFLTLAAHHYGSEAVNHTLSQLEKELRHMERQIQSLEADRPKFANNPAQLQMFERALQKYKDQIDKGLSFKYACQGVLLDDQIQARSMQFMRYVIVWLLRLVSGNNNFPKQPLALPLPEAQPDVFRCLPEYFLEDVVGNFKFIMRNMPHIITSTQSDELIMICITFLRSSEYVKNPYLKAGLVTIMFNGVWPAYGKTKGVLGDQLSSLPLATEHLLHSLMKFYIEAEHTGAHTAFYDKFNIRYEIFQIIKCIWSNPIYRKKLSIEAKVNLDFFVRFVNLLLNDVTFVLDESLTSFKKIHELQKLLQDKTLDPQVRTEKSEALSEAESKAKTYMQLTNETVSMLKLFTEALADSFTMPEVVQRLADMLDYNLEAMVGPKSRDLRVENLSELGFDPKKLLSEIVDVYLNLGGKDSFILAVARDGRSYKPGTFENATSLLKRLYLKSPEDIQKWTTLSEQFKKMKEIDDQAEEDLGEIPDEFLDPLMFTLMEDPVILPSSKNVIDRATIRSHLLSDPNDPFNRVPLKIEDVLPDTDLRARIEAFKAEKKGARRADIMDTTAG